MLFLVSCHFSKSCIHEDAGIVEITKSMQSRELEQKYDLIGVATYPYYEKCLLTVHTMNFNDPCFICSPSVVPKDNIITLHLSLGHSVFRFFAVCKVLLVVLKTEYCKPFCVRYACMNMNN